MSVGVILSLYVASDKRDCCEHRLEAIPILADEFQRLVTKYFDNSLENIGRKDSVRRYALTV